MKASMKRLRWMTPLVAVSIVAFVPVVEADTLQLRNGDFYQGIIQEVSGGQVQMEVSREVLTFDILDVESMKFDTPHLLATGADPAMEHFLSDLESQEVVQTFAELDSTAEELQRLMTQVRMYWEARQPIDAREEQAWEAARDRFRRPMSRYQELLNDLYFHFLARVDEYNSIANDADDIYVGVRGVFNIGAPLLPDGMDQLSLRRYVPTGWYDTIYYEGYNSGYYDAFLNVTSEPPNDSDVNDD